MNRKIDNGLPFACYPDAIEAAQRERHQCNTQQLLTAAQATHELADGYAFRFPAESDIIIKAAEFTRLERLCCPFFNFVLEIEPDNGPLWLKLTGPPGIKQVLRTELGL